MNPKVVHISALDMGGAATAAFRLHKAMLGLGIDSQFLTLGKANRNIPNKQVFEIIPEPLSLKNVFLKSIKTKLGLESPHDFDHQQTLLLGREPTGSGFNFPDTQSDITKSKIYQQADIVHLHWVAGWLDYPSFFAKNSKPVVWTLHDLNPFSGGLHYALGTSIDETQMGKYIENPQNHLQKAHNRNLNIKQKSLENTDKLKIVSPSNWLKKQAQESVLFSKYHHSCIRYGLNTQIFKPYPQQQVRGILGLEDKKTLLFVADDVDSLLKGFHVLVKALAISGEKVDYQYLVVGRDRSNSLHSLPNVKHLGYVQDEQLIALAYSAADAFVLPSLMDNFPNTMLESICCGTPVITFPTGGIPEAILANENGIICQKADENVLAQILIGFYEGNYSFERAKIAKNAAEKYDEIIQANQYINLYQSFL